MIVNAPSACSPLQRPAIEYAKAPARDRDPLYCIRFTMCSEVDNDIVGADPKSGRPAFVTKEL